MARRGRPPAIGRDELLSSALEVLRERGVARLTTREVASRAGVSEGSIFYHFGDRQAMLKAVFEKALRPMVRFRSTMDASQVTDLSGVRVILDDYTSSVQAFLAEGLDVLVAAHGDAELRDEVGAFMVANDYGPHRGTEAIGGFLADVQRAGVIDQAVDPHVAAHLLVGATFLRCVQPKLVGNAKAIPPNPDVLDTVMRMLSPA